MDATVLKYCSAKGNNKRVSIALCEDNTTKEKYFFCRTRTLVDFKKRDILTTENIFSVETMAVYYDVLDHIFTTPQIRNKILLKELNAVRKFKGTSNFRK